MAGGLSGGSARLAAAVFLMAAVGLAAGGAYSEEAASAVSGSTIQPFDKLNIQVYREPELSGVHTVGSVGFAVDSSGDIDYPLLGKIKVSGMTPQELQAVIRDRLEKDYLNNPQVQVSVHERGVVNGLSLLGQVVKPGNYKHSPGLTLVRAISDAGGFVLVKDPQRLGSASIADASRVRITRRGEDGRQKAFSVDVNAILEGRAPDIAVEPWDLVYVPEKGAGNRVSLLGQVARPGNYDLTPGMTLIQLISEAQGFTRFAAPADVAVTRAGPDGGKKRMRVNADAVVQGRADDLVLEPGDVVFVPESLF
jgi:polysaccharide export outer membrane protein